MSKCADGSAFVQDVIEKEGKKAWETAYADYLN
jgi:hypothetical protein